MLRLMLLGLMTAVLAISTPVFAQCGGCNCGGGCTSGCGCGCNSPENMEPPGRSGMTGFTSDNVEFLSRLSLSEMGGTSGVLGNDCWGWTDPSSGREFAIFGMTDGTAFVEITDPLNPVFLGRLPTAQGNTTWRDMKVYDNRAYIVADGSGNSNHGVQVFQLKRLLRVSSPPQTFVADARYTDLGRSHNIAINEMTGYAYAVGSSSLGSSGGLIMLDLKQGLMPVLAGVYNDDGYTHDVQVVLYHGADQNFTGPPLGSPANLLGREIAFCCNEDTLTIVDVTDKSNPVQLSRKTYPFRGYTHQGWLSEDHRFFFMDDELDEQQQGPTPTRTHVWWLRSLTNPVYLGFVEGEESTIDHNCYVKGNYIYQANYTSGLQILKIENPRRLQLPRAGFFDTYPANNNVTFNGAWSVYPYFPSGNLIVSDRQNGLFVLRFDPLENE